MERIESIIRAVQPVLEVPLMPAPARGKLPCAVYRYHPGECTGDMAKSRLVVRIIAPTLTGAIRQMTAIRCVLVADGDSGVLEDAGGTLLIYETDEDSAQGFLRGLGMYYVKAGFEILGHA